MFPRVLYLDEAKALEINWMGLGALRIRYRQGPIRRAHSLQKKIFLAIVRQFELAGQPVSPSNPRCSKLFHDYIELLEKPMSSLAWQAVFQSTPEEIGQAYARE